MINSTYTTDRSTNKAYFKHCRSKVKEYMKEAPESHRELIKSLLDEMPQCYTLCYEVIIRL